MKRLTVKKEDERYSVRTASSIPLVIKKLGQYEDAEEQGMLLRLPCKVEDTVYYADVMRKFVDECKVTKIDCKSVKPDYIGISIEFIGKLWHCISAELFEKVVFYTKEEAEQALAEVARK